MSAIIIKSHIRDYDVTFIDYHDFSHLFVKYSQRIFVIDHNVWRLYANDLLRELTDEKVIVLPIHEEGKSLETAQNLYDNLIQYAAKRNMTLISIGGGILQDISGFVASTLYRGINWIFVPTTLLAQADSCIGSKTSLNYKNYKNLIGTFYPPSHVYIYPQFVLTQSDPDFFSGLGEVVKLHMMGGDKKVIEILDLLPGIIKRNAVALFTSVKNSLLIKNDYIADDEFDTGKRNLLNFGHCFGHALESTSEFEIPHGQAVVLGMWLANIVARNRGLLSEGQNEFIAHNLLLPTIVINSEKDFLNTRKIIEAMKKDKKRTGKDLAVIMMKDNYEFIKVNDVKESEVTEALSEFKKVFMGLPMRINKF
ncbi:MAG: AroB-related putative sugar phosphate phospholyase (cyclizing) [Syntrophaceae bacterium]